MPQTDLSSLPTTAFEDVATLAARRSARWRPGLAAQQGKALHTEIFASSREGAGAGAALALALDDWRSSPRGEGEEAEDRRSVLWVQTRDAARLGGRPYRAGLPKDLQARVIHVLADKAEDALFAMEEGLRCRELAFVIGEVSGNAKALDFTASRRLTLTAQKHSVPLFLLRVDAGRDLSSARMRWEITSAPSNSPEWNAQAPGDPAWKAELFRARSHAPGEWVLGEKDGRLSNNPLPDRGEDTKDWRRRSLAGVGEGFARLRAGTPPSPSYASSFGASAAILSPQGERVGA